MSLEAITIPAAQPATGLIVLLHGWGANAEDVAALAPLLNLPNYQLIMPNAPFAHPYSVEGRMWYGFPDTYDFQSRFDFQDREDLAASRQILIDWLRSLAETTGIPLAQTFLAGFSQGGAMTLDVGLHLPLAGLMVLSGYLHAPVQPEALAKSPVLIVHGRQDDRVPLQAAQYTRDNLSALAVPVQYYEFNMGHEIQISVLNLMRDFVLGVT